MQRIDRRKRLGLRPGFLAALMLACLLPVASFAQEELEEETAAASEGSVEQEEEEDDGAADASELWYTPMPASQQAQVAAAASALQQKLSAATSSGGWVARARCRLSKLEAPDSDDRLIEWSRICPGYVENEGWQEREVCSAGRDFTEEDLHEQIDLAPKVDEVGPRFHIFTHLKSEAYHLNRLFGGERDVQAVLGELQRLDDDVEHALAELTTRAGQGGDEQRHYRAIQQWVSQRQQDPNSVYSCR